MKPPSLCSSSSSDEEDNSRRDPGGTALRPSGQRPERGGRRTDSISSSTTRTEDKSKAAEAHTEALKLKEVGNEFYRNMQYNEAISKYEAAIIRDKNNPDIHSKNDHFAKVKSNIALCYLKKKDYKQALEAALSAAAALPEYSRSYYRCSSALLGMNLKVPAVFALHKGLVCAKDKEELRQEMDKIKKEEKAACLVVEKKLIEMGNNQEDIKRFLRSLDLAVIVNTWQNTAELKASYDEDGDLSDDDEDDGGKPSSQRSHQPMIRKDQSMDKMDNQSLLPKEKSEAEKKKRERETALLCQQEYQQLVMEGSKSFQNKVPRTCVDKMGRALEILANKHASLRWGKGLKFEDNPEVVAVKYVYGSACIDTNCYDTILLGRTVLDSILSQHKGVRFPAVYLGFGKLYKKLNRYEMGLDYVNRGLEYLARGLAVEPCSWPGLPLQPLEETILENLVPLLRALQLELRSPPRPDAVCKFATCATVQHHILPSENIHLSDPDYRGFYRVHCLDNCIMDYHKSCWMALKESYIMVFKLTKLPTERDFFGRACFTPDCSGRIYKIEVHDQDGTCACFEDKAVEEERERKREAKVRHTDQKSSSKTKIINDNNNKKFKKNKTGIKNNLLTEDGDGSDSLVAVDGNNKSVTSSGTDNQLEPVDYSTIDVSNAVVIKKNRGGEINNAEEEEETKRKKKAAANKKHVISLGEFIGNTGGVERNPEQWPGHVASFAGTGGTFEERLARARGEAFRACLEGDDVDLKPSATASLSKPLQAEFKRFSFSSSQGYNNSSRSSGASSPLQYSSEEQETRRESILTYIYDLLKNNGPQLIHRPWLTLDPESEKLIGGRDHLADFLTNDERDRFTVYKEKYVCIASDLSKAIQMYNNAQATLPPQSVQIIDIDEDLGRFASRMKAKLLNWKPEEEVVTTQKTPILTPTSVDSRGLTLLSCGIQTDVSSRDLEEHSDVISLQQANSQLAEELQESRDRLYQIQKDKKVEIKELTDSNAALTEDLKRVRAEAQKYRDEVAKMRKTCTEAVERERELKTSQEKLEAARQEIRQLRQKVEEEQELSFQLSIRQKKDHDEIKQLRLDVATRVVAYKEMSLHAEAQMVKRIIDYRLGVAARAVRFLMGMSGGSGGSSAAASQVINELNQYVARLTFLKDEVDQQVVEKCQRVADPDFLPSFDCDLSQIELPSAGSQELTTLLMSLVAPPPLAVKHDCFTAGGMTQPLRPVSVGSMPPPPPGMQNFLPRGQPQSGEIRGFPSEVTAFGYVGRPSTSPAPSSETLFPVHEPPRPASNPGPSVRLAPPPQSPSPALAPPSANIRAALLPPQASRPAAASPAPLASRPAVLAPSAVRPAVQPTPVVRPAAQPLLGSRPIGQDRPVIQMSGGADNVPRPRDDAAAGRSLKKNHEKLLVQLISQYPVLTETIANRYIQQLRQSNGGKLSGMSLPEIYKRVGSYIQRDSAGLEEQDMSEDCAICTETMDQGIVISLDPCGHRFHRPCVRKWLELEKAGNTCPICRTFVTRDDEFPSLS